MTFNNEIIMLTSVLLHVRQGCPTLFLEVYLPADFSSNPDQTHLSVINQVLLQTLISWFSCGWSRLELNSEVDLQEQGWAPLM